MDKVKNIIFDLGGVLLDIDYNLTKKAFEELGVKDFDAMYSQAAADKLFSDLERGSINPHQFYRKLNECTGLSLSDEEIDRAWNAMLLDFREESLEFLDKINNGYHIYLLSNTNCIHLEAFDKIYFSKPRDKGFRQYFKHCFYSFEMGQRKPDIACYQIVLDQLKTDQSDTLFVDDSIQNIEAAQRLGIKTLFLEKPKRIENELKYLLD